MELINLVSHLLYKHNCVIIPSFGALIANIKESTIDLDRNNIKPIRKQIVFNESLVENDGLLTNALATRKSISYETAEKEVAQFVDFIVDRIDRYKNYEFKNVGSFYLNKDKNIIFVPYDGLNFYAKSYGLPSLKIKQLKAEKPIVPIPQTISKKSDIHWFRVAAAVVVLLFAGLLTLKTVVPSKNQNLAENTSEQKSNKNIASIIPSIYTDRSETKETIQPIPETTIENKLVAQIDTALKIEDENIAIKKTLSEAEKSIKKETKKVDIESLKKQYDKYMAPKTMFYIVVGVYNDVNKYKIKKLKRRAYNPELIKGTHPNEKLICLEKFTNQDRAREYLSIVKRYDDKNARILEKLN